MLMNIVFGGIGFLLGTINGLILAGLPDSTGARKVGRVDKVDDK